MMDEQTTTTTTAPVLTPPLSAVSAPSAPAAPVGIPGPVTALSIAEQMKAGTLTTAQAGTLARAGGIDAMEILKAHAILIEPVQPKAPDQRSDEVKDLDAAFPAGKESDYLIYYGPEAEAGMTPELKQFDTSARTWLAGAKFPRELGNSLISAIDRLTRTTQSMTPEELESYGVSEFEKLQRRYGDQLEDKLRLAGRMVDELEKKQPGVKQLLQSKGIGDNALVASLLMQQSERYWARRGGK